MAKNVNRTARLQWKVDTIKNCIYLQCIVLTELGPGIGAKLKLNPFGFLEPS